MPALCMPSACYLNPTSHYARFIQYNPTSLERGHKHELQTEVDLGVPIDLILPEVYACADPNGESPPAGRPTLGRVMGTPTVAAALSFTDEALLEEEVVQQPESKRSATHT